MDRVLVAKAGEIGPYCVVFKQCGVGDIDIVEGHTLYFSEECWVHLCYAKLVMIWMHNNPLV